MTGSVSTRGMKGACFTDEEREVMYVEAIKYYIDNLLFKDKSQKIVFAENSGWDLKLIKAKLPSYDEERVEFISLHADEFDISRGKGYNELLMINKVVERSKFIKEAGYFFKVTGRYPIYNIAYFLNKAVKILLENGYDMYCDMKDHNLYDICKLGWNGHSFECRLFGVRNLWYKEHIAPLYAECNDYNGKPMETVLFRNVKNGGVRLLSVLGENHILVG